jgi:hypothetical protein
MQKRRSAGCGYAHAASLLARNRYREWTRASSSPADAAEGVSLRTNHGFVDRSPVVESELDTAMVVTSACGGAAILYLNSQNTVT